MSAMCDRLESLLDRGGIRTRRVKVLGPYAHIDTFQKYEANLLDLMSLAGWAIHSVSNGRHMDSFDGFRMVFCLPAQD
jgi:hypothetical protein